MSVVSFSQVAMARLSASLKTRPSDASNAELMALAEYSAKLGPGERAALARLAGRMAELERTEPAGDLDRRLSAIETALSQKETRLA
jgi:hypothetical protein